MILNIAPNNEKSFDKDCYTLPNHMLQLKATHLFIASNKWDTINIQITDDVPLGSLHCLSLVCSDINISLPEVVTDKTVQLVCEALPDKAGTIRRACLQGKSLQEVLSSV